MSTLLADPVCVICKRSADRTDYCFGCRQFVCQACNGPAEFQFTLYAHKSHTVIAHLALAQLEPARRN